MTSLIQMKFLWQQEQESKDCALKHSTVQGCNNKIIENCGKDEFKVLEKSHLGVFMWEHLFLHVSTTCTRKI